MNFLAQASQLPFDLTTGQALGGGGVSVGAILFYLFGPALRSKMPGATAGIASPMQEGDSQKLGEVHQVVTARDTSGRPMAYFDREMVSKEHDKQDEAHIKQALIMERVVVVLDRIDKRNGG